MDKFEPFILKMSVEGFENFWKFKASKRGEMEGNNGLAYLPINMKVELRRRQNFRGIFVVFDFGTVATEANFP